MDSCPSDVHAISPVNKREKKISSLFEMNLKAPIGLDITTYEFSDNKSTPILSHVFWGQDLDEAIGYAKSHLISDVFFSASFIGELPWRDTILHLSSEGDILSVECVPHDKIQDAINRVAQHAVEVYKAQEQAGVIQVIHYLSKQD